MAAIELYSTPLFGDSNLIHYYRFEGNSNDSKGSTNGTDVSVSYSASYGFFGQGVYFNGSARIYFSGHVTSSNSPFSVSFWMKSATTGLSTIFADGIAWDGDNAGVYLWLGDSSGKPFFQLRNGVSNGQSNLQSTTNVYNGNWHHVVLTCTGDTSSNGQKVYVDGSLNAQMTPNFNVANPSGSNYYLGSGRSDSNVYNYTGYLDDLAFFSRVLTPTEVNNLYTGNWPKGGIFFHNYL